MKKIAGVLFLLLVLSAAGCGGADKDSKPKPKPEAAFEVTFASLGGDKWPIGEAGISLDNLPVAPVGFTAAEVKKLAVIIVGWAKTAALDERVFHSDSPAVIVAATLPTFPGNDLYKDFNEAASPRLSAANVFGADVQLVGQPRMTSAWKATRMNGDDGLPYLSVQLQTRVAYEVKGTKKGTRVIGVVRKHGLSSYGARQVGEQFGENWGWQEFGAGGCALATDDALVPDDNKARVMKELNEFLVILNSPSLIEQKIDEEDRVTDNYKQRCEDGGV